MPYTLSIATPEARDLVVAALREAADKRSRVARTAGRGLAIEKRGGKDVRSGAVRVAMILGEAGDLEALAEELASAANLPILERLTNATIAIPDPADEADPLTPADLGQLAGDDGTSLEAQALAALAGLSPSDPDAVEDPLTNALPEDEPTKPEEIL